MPDFLTPEQQVALMQVDLEIAGIVRDLDESMGWEADDEDRGLMIQYLRWAYIDGYCADREGVDPNLRLLTQKM